MKRAAGAVGRATRGAAGRPESGSDELFRVLHAEHEEVSQLFEKVLAAEDPKRATEILREHRKGVVGLSACMGGYLAQEILQKGSDHARKDHGMEEIPPDLAMKVQAAIHNE